MYIYIQHKEKQSNKQYFLNEQWARLCIDIQIFFNYVQMPKGDNINIA